MIWFPCRKNARAHLLTHECAELIMQAPLLDASLGNVHELLNSDCSEWADLRFDKLALDTVFCMPWPLSFLIIQGKFGTMGFNAKEFFPRGSSLTIFMQTWRNELQLHCPSAEEGMNDDDASDHYAAAQAAQAKDDQSHLLNPAQFQMLADYLRANRSSLANDEDEQHVVLDSHIQWLERCAPVCIPCCTFKIIRITMNQ